MLKQWLGFPCGSSGKESACNARDLGSILGLGRSPGEGKGCPLQYCGLENSMDCTVYGVGGDWATVTLTFILSSLPPLLVWLVGLGVLFWSSISSPVKIKKPGYGCLYFKSTWVSRLFYGTSWKLHFKNLRKRGIKAWLYLPGITLVPR